jgi:hypothetical protein
VGREGQGGALVGKSRLASEVIRGGGEGAEAGADLDYSLVGRVGK